MIAEKRCAGCRALKPKIRYGRCKGRNDGLKWYCKICNRIHDRKRRKKSTHKLSEYRRYIRKTNPDVIKLQENLRSSIYRCFKSKKTNRTEEILGCTNMELHLRLGPRPQYAHLDHIIPQSLAKTEEEVYLLNHWSNFQWLKDSENISKGNRYTKKHNYKYVLKHHPFPEKIRGIVNRAKNEGFQVLSETLQYEAL